VWGLASALPYLASGLLVLFGAAGSGSTVEFVLILPMLVQEMFLAVWLIAKGFNENASAALSGTLVIGGSK
jgi:hypothetical protein